MIERFAAEFRFGPPLSNNFVRARIFSERNAFVWQIRNLEKQIPLLLVEAGRALIKIDNLVADLSHFPKRIGYNSCVENGSPRYQDLIASARVHDRALFLPLRTPNELELQARWFAGEFGKNFVSASGDKIDIVQFGTWNREAGPDFCDAAVRVNGSEPLRGCIEIDLVDRNWALHGHA